MSSRDSFPGAEPWRLLPYDVGPSASHFALSDALARLAETPTLWWHATATPTVILGAGQRDGDIDRAACLAAGVSIVQRHAGGTAVYAASGVLGLDIALPPGHPLLLADIVEAYRWLGEVWTLTARMLGAAAHVVQIDEARRAQAVSSGAASGLRLACFGSLSPYEVAIRNRKLVGLSQVRRRGRELLQSAVHLSFDAEVLAALLAVDDRRSVARELHRAALGLDEATGRPCTAEEVMEAFGAALHEAVGVLATPGAWTEAELRHAQAAGVAEDGA